MIKDLAVFAKKTGVKYFMISYTDLFGVQRAKLVPTQAIADMQVEVLVLQVLQPGLILLLRIQICCLLYTSPSPRDATLSRMPSSA